MFPFIEGYIINASLIQGKSRWIIYGKKRRSTFHVPFYMKFIRCADKYKPNKLKTKFNRNVRSKSTHSSFRFYR